MTYKRAHRVPWRTVDGKAVLVSVRNSEVIVLNEVGTELWGFLSEERTPDSIVEHLYSKFEADKNTIEKEAMDFLTELDEKEVLDVGQDK